MARFVPLSEEERASPRFVPSQQSSPRFVPLSAQAPAMETLQTPQMQEGPAAPIPPQTTDVMPVQRREDPRTLREGAQRVGEVGVGAAEVAGTAATGGAAEVMAGLAGLVSMLRGGDDRMQRAADVVEEVLQTRTFQPRTETGQQMLEGVSRPFQALGEMAGKAGEATLDATGSPAAATAVHTGMEFLPALAGARFGRPGRARRQEDVRRVDQGAQELGVDMNTGVTPQRQQIVEGAERMASAGMTDDMGRPIVGARGESMPDVQAGMQAAAGRARDAKNLLYQKAKQGDAAVTLDDAVGLADRLAEVRQDFLTQDMPQANRLLGEVEQLRTIQKRRDDLVKQGGQPKDIAVTINQMEEWGQKVRRNQPNQRTDPAQHAAMERMIKIKDDFMDELFNADMISGDPDTIAAWRRARAANASYRERFSDNKVIRDMVEMEAEPETVRKWIFGANAAGAKSEAASVVRRIKTELGEDSPQFKALRQDAVLDLLDPMLGPDPNLKGFIRRFDNFVGRNPGLARDLYGENLQGLTNLRDLAQAHRDRPVVAISELPGGARILGVAAFGHELARKALTVRAATTGATMLARTTTPSPRRRMMGDILGYDPFKPMFGARAAAIGAGSQELMDPAQEQSPNAPGMSESIRGLMQEGMNRNAGQ